MFPCEIDCSIEIIHDSVTMFALVDSTNFPFSTLKVQRFHPNDNGFEEPFILAPCDDDDRRKPGNVSASFDYH